MEAPNTKFIKWIPNDSIWFENLKLVYLPQGYNPENYLIRTNNETYRS